MVRRVEVYRVIPPVEELASMMAPAILDWVSAEPRPWLRSAMARTAEPWMSAIACSMFGTPLKNRPMICAAAP